MNRLDNQLFGWIHSGGNKTHFPNLYDADQGHCILKIVNVSVMQDSAAILDVETAIKTAYSREFLTDLNSSLLKEQTYLYCSPSKITTKLPVSRGGIYAECFMFD